MRPRPGELGGQVVVRVNLQQRFEAVRSGYASASGHALAPADRHGAQVRRASLAGTNGSAVHAAAVIGAGDRKQ